MGTKNKGGTGMDSSKAKKTWKPKNAPKVKVPSRSKPNFMKEYKTSAPAQTLNKK